MRHVRSASELEEILRAGRALLFKHSARCGASLRALREVEAYESSAGAVDVYLLDVLADRQLSREVAERIGVRHESPQAILLEDGVPIIPVSVSMLNDFICLLDADPPVDLEKDDLPKDAWTNYYRQDDVCAVAFFYLDRPDNGLPPLAPVAERTAALE